MYGAAMLPAPLLRLSVGGLLWAESENVSGEPIAVVIATNGTRLFLAVLAPLSLAPFAPPSSARTSATSLLAPPLIVKIIEKRELSERSGEKNAVPDVGRKMTITCRRMGAELSLSDVAPPIRECEGGSRRIARFFNRASRPPRRARYTRAHPRRAVIAFLPRHLLG